MRDETESTEAGACTTDSWCCAPLRVAPISAEDATLLAGRLKALADPVRLRMLSLIASAPDGEACVCDLTGPLERSQATVSHHLSQLTQAGILTREQRGKWAWFRLNAADLERICNLVCAPGTEGLCS